MTKLVHVRRHMDRAQPTIDFRRQTDVRVLELRIECRPLEVGHQLPQRSAEGENPGDMPSDAPQRFARMLAERRGDFDLAIAVMHAVKAPPQTKLVHTVFGNWLERDS